MHVIFAGTPAPAVSVLEALVESGHSVCAALTRPDRPTGRGRKSAPPPVKESARRHGIPLLQPENINSPESLDEIKTLAPDAAVVAFYGRIIGKEMLALPKNGWLNIHPSLLPKYRGPSPVAAAILNGDKKTGVTVIKLDEGMDSGPILIQETYDIHEDENAGELLIRLARAGAALIPKALDSLERGDALIIPQDEDAATVTGMFKKSDGIIDWSRKNIHDFVRAMSPWPGARARLHVNAADSDVDLTVCRTGIPAQTTSSEAAPGTIISITHEGILVRDACSEIFITAVKAAGKKEVPARDFANGCRVKAGDRFIKITK